MRNIIARTRRVNTHTHTHTGRMRGDRYRNTRMNCIYIYTRARTCFHQAQASAYYRFGQSPSLGCCAWRRTRGGKIEIRGSSAVALLFAMLRLFFARAKRLRGRRRSRVWHCEVQVKRWRERGKKKSFPDLSGTRLCAVKKRLRMRNGGWAIREEREARGALYNDV